MIVFADKPETALARAYRKLSEASAAGAAAGAAVWDAARAAADAVWDAARDADFYDAISQAAAWVDEFERLWPVPFYRECCYRAGKEACQFVEWIHHDGTSAVMCEACWYSRLDEIEIDKPEDEREERLRRIVVA